MEYFDFKCYKYINNIRKQKQQSELKNNDNIP